MSETSTEPEEAPESPETLDVAIAALRPSLEALLMVADEPLDQVTLASAVGHPTEAVVEALHALAEEYAQQGRGFELRNVAGGWRYYTREEYAAVVEAFVIDGQQARLTKAALETLAVVAYKQPISRARVSAIRGVNVDGVVRTLLTRGLLEEAGQDEETGAHLYRTTSYFLERIGITDLDDLPELAPYLPDMDDLEDDLAAMAGGSPTADGPALEHPAEEADNGSVTDPSASTNDPGSDEARHREINEGGPVLPTDEQDTEELPRGHTEESGDEVAREVTEGGPTLDSDAE